MWSAKPFVCLTSAFFVATSWAQSVEERIIREARDNSRSHALLTEMADRFGPRVTASDSLLAAQRWALAKFKSFGVDNVVLEPYATAPVRFQRGRASRGGFVSPYRMDIPFTTPAYTVGTRGPVAGEAVDCPASLEEAKKNPSRYKRAWILMPTAVGMRGPVLRAPTEVDKFLDTCGIAGRVYGTTSDRYVWTHGIWTDYTVETRPKAPLVVVTKRDFGLVQYNLAQGRPTTLEFNVDNYLADKPTQLVNVVAEIRGSEKPEEFVLVGAHQDSWDGPGSQGAMDNGTGSALVLEVARVFGKLKLRPKRSVRFILWSGEEQGLLGSRAYSAAHKAELDRMQAGFNEDGGQNPYRSLEVPESIVPYFRDPLAKLVGSFPEYPVELKVSTAFPNGGSDLRSFLDLGIPGFALQKTEGPVNYTEIWHTQLDRVSLVSPRAMAQNATYVAVLAHHLADIPDRLPKIKLN